MFSLRLRTVVLVTVDFVELLNQTSGDLSIAHGLKLTDVYNAATQDQDVFLETYALCRILLIRFYTLYKLFSPRKFCVYK